jgi:hypothetical protein
MVGGSLLDAVGLGVNGDVLAVGGHADIAEGEFVHLRLAIGD